MKRIIIGLLLFLSVSLCFAGGKFEVGLGYHGMIFNGNLTFEANQDYPELIMDINKNFPSFAINFAFIPYFTESFGFGFYGNFLLSTKEGDFPINGLDFLLGPAFMLYSNETISVSLTPGMHMSIMLLDKTSLSKQIGLGGNVTGEYHFTPKVYAYARFQLSCDLYSWYSHGGTSSGNALVGYGGKKAQEGNGDISAWNINPCIGLGFKW